MEENKNKWIPVEERLPREGQNVLIAIQDPLMGGHDILTVKRVGDDWQCPWDSEVVFSKENENDMYRPTHWMPLPDGPKTQS